MPAFNVSLRKSWNGRNQRNSWVNNYDIVTNIALNAPEWQQAIDALVAAEARLHLQPVAFLSAVVSTYDQEETYRYENLRTFTLNAQGTKDPAAQAGGTLPTGMSGAADLNFVLQMNKDALLGRKGKVYYRGALTVFDIAADGYGKPTLSNDGFAKFDNEMTLVNQALDTLPEGMQLVMMPDINRAAAGAGDGEQNGDPEQLNVRDWNHLSVGGVVLLPRDHKYFDRAPKAGGEPAVPSV